MKKSLLVCLSAVFLFANIEIDLENEFKSEKNNDTDYLSVYNEHMTYVNDFLYEIIFNPVAKTYEFIVPEIPRTGISNFFTNISYPVRLVNNVLQLKLDDSVQETERFFINTTLGFAGFVDVAKDKFSIYHSDEDFGQTLGYYGVPAGQHVVVPILGQSNLRDIVGMGVDYFFHPVTYVSDNTTRRFLNISYGVNELPELMNNYFNYRKDAIDLYPFFKTGYEAYRMKEISK
jgi:phospholipid-binding lipoprotein MlaA